MTGAALLEACVARHKVRFQPGERFGSALDNYIRLSFSYYSREDLVVGADAIGLCQRLAQVHGGCAVVLDPQRDIARLVVRGWSLDLARRSGGSLAADLARRDYRINAIALPLGPGEPLLDPLGGLVDLQARQLVAVGEANLLDDPLRLLRGIRLAAQLDFTLEASTWTWIQRHHQRLASVAGERVLAELDKLATAPRGHQGLQQALVAGLLQPWGADARAGAALGRLNPEQAQTCGLNPEERQLALPLARLWLGPVCGPWSIPWRH
jgi:tRNA nucleotidyltransferase (CCA-adding enzyme)